MASTAASHNRTVSQSSGEKFIPWEPYRGAVTRPEENGTAKSASKPARSSSTSTEPIKVPYRIQPAIRKKSSPSFYLADDSKTVKIVGSASNPTVPALLEQTETSGAVPHADQTISKPKIGQNSPSPIGQNSAQLPIGQNSRPINGQDQIRAARESISERRPEGATQVQQNGVEAEGFATLNSQGQPTVTPSSGFKENKQQSVQENYSRLQAAYERLCVENKSLKDELQMQANINGELKKLVVASMGEDLQLQLDSLSNDKVRLAQEVVNYSHKLSVGSENVEALAIESDMWRSKYLASSVMVDELVSWRMQLVRKVEEAQGVLFKLQEEHHIYREHSFQTLLLMTEIIEALAPLDKSHSGYKKLLSYHSLYDLVTVVHSLADRLHSRLMEGRKKELLETQPVRTLTVAEEAAQRLCEVDTSAFLASSPCSDTKESTAERQARLLGLSPHCKYKNLTINCCAQCYGEIKLV